MPGSNILQLEGFQIKNSKYQGDEISPQAAFAKDLIQFIDNGHRLLFFQRQEFQVACKAGHIKGCADSFTRDIPDDQSQAIFPDWKIIV